MAYEILESSGRPPLILTPTTTVYSGSFRVGPRGRVVVQVRGADAEPFTFWLPDAPPLSPGEPEPGVWAEAFLVQAVITGDSGFPVGVRGVSVGFAPDPRGGPARWLLLQGGAFATGGLVVGYRVTVQRSAVPSV